MRGFTGSVAAVLVVAAAVGGLGAWGCASWAREGLDPSTMPAEVRPDYALYAQRCSKCHSLARSLTSGIDSDAYWVDYVARMRRQPASGISQEDTVGILRFLHYFSIEERRKAGKPLEMPPGAPPPTTSASPPPATTSPPAASAPSAAALHHGAASF